MDPFMDPFVLPFIDPFMLPFVLPFIDTFGFTYVLLVALFVYELVKLMINTRIRSEKILFERENILIVMYRNLRFKKDLYSGEFELLN